MNAHMGWAFVVVLLWSSPSWAETLPTTVWLRSEQHGFGTGWVVDAERRWLVTARHVVGDRPTVEAYFPDGSHILRRHYLEQQQDLRTRGRIVTGKVIARRDHADLALIELEQLPKGTPALRLAKGPMQGEFVQLLGQRHDAETLWTATTGHVRQTGTLREGYFWAAQKLGVGAKVTFLQMPVEAGDSGAAVRNAAGDVVGVLSAFLTHTPGVATAIHPDEIRQLLADTRKEKAPEPKPMAPHVLADQLQRATVWVRPQATQTRCAGVLIDGPRRLVLTTLTGAGADDVLTVVFPQFHEWRLLAEADAYRDHLGQRLHGTSVRAVVLARDRRRDVALLELEQLPATAQALSLAHDDPPQGTAIHTMNHPLGLELLWLYAAGRVRSAAKIALDSEAKETDPKPQVSVLQIPHQGSSSGGAVLDDRGLMVGLLATREGPRQEMGYAVTPSELHAFLKQVEPLWRPTTGRAWATRGDFFAARSQWTNALTAYQQALLHEPEQNLYQCRVIEALLATGQRDAARKRLMAFVVNAKPEPKADIQALIGQLLLTMGEPHLALLLVAQALKQEPKCIPALLGRAQMRSGQAALDDLAEVLFLDPNNAQPFAVRANKHDPRDPETPTKQLADLSRAVELRPYDLDLRRARAKAYSERKEWKKARADWVRLAELADTNADVWLGLAMAQLQAGDEVAARGALVAVVRVEGGRLPAVLRILRQQAQTLDQAGADGQQVCDWYEQALQSLQPWLPPMKQEQLQRTRKTLVDDPVRRRQSLEALLNEWLN